MFTAVAGSLGEGVSSTAISMLFLHGLREIGDRGAQKGETVSLFQDEGTPWSSFVLRRTPVGVTTSPT